MSRKVVDLTIRLKDGVTGTLGKIRGGLNKLSKNIFNLKNLFRGMALATPFIALSKAVNTAFKFETLRTQIKVLVGSVKEANKVFNELKDFSAKTPFELPGIVAAYRQLKNFTGEALSTQEGLTLVGDAAAATSSDFKETAFWTGRLYSSLKNGSPFLDSVGAMERLGIVGGELRGTLTKMTSDGASLGEMWGLVEQNLKKFEGGMSDLSKTGGGLISTLKDNWTIAVATFGEVFTEAAKGGISDLIAMLQKLTKDGTITAWAEQAKSAFQAVVETIQLLKDPSTREEAMANVVGLLKAGFLDAAESAGNLLIVMAPKIGSAIGQAAKAVLLSFGEGSADRAVAEKRVGDRGDFERALPFTPASRRNEARIQAELKKIQAEKNVSFEGALSGAVVSGKGSRVDKYLKENKKLRAENLEQERKAKLKVVDEVSQMNASAEGAGNALLRIAPKVGEILGSSAKSAMLGLKNKDKMTDEQRGIVIFAAEQEDGTDAKNARFAEIKSYYEKQNRNNRWIREGNEAAGKDGEERSRFAVALKENKKLRAENLEQERKAKLKVVDEVSQMNASAEAKRMNALYKAQADAIQKQQASADAAAKKEMDAAAAAAKIKTDAATAAAEAEVDGAKKAISLKGGIGRQSAGDKLIDTISKVFRKGSGREGWQKAFIDKEIARKRQSLENFKAMYQGVTGSEARISEYKDQIRDLGIVKGGIDGNKTGVLGLLKQYSSNYFYEDIKKAILEGEKTTEQTKQTQLLRDIRDNVGGIRG